MSGETAAPSPTGSGPNRGTSGPGLSAHDQPAPGLSAQQQSAPGLSAQQQTAQRQSSRLGLGLGISAYLLWGFLPLYLRLLSPAGSVEVIAHRVVWSLVICLGVVAVTGRIRALGQVLRDRRALVALAGSGILLTANWLTFVYSIASNQLAEGALGYFINPLITVALAVFFLREHLTTIQWVALGIAGSAVLVISIAQARFPWIALVLGISFGLYGYVEKRVGRSVPAATAMTVETLVVAPFAIAYMVWIATQGNQHFTGLGPWHAAAMVGVGIATAVPLLLFNGAARRLPLSVVGLLQYMCPVMQFLTALLIFHEHMEPARWVGFALVWIALIILVTDGLRRMRAQPKPSTSPR